MISDHNESLMRCATNRTINLQSLDTPLKQRIEISVCAKILGRQVQTTKRLLLLLVNFIVDIRLTRHK